MTVRSCVLPLALLSLFISAVASGQAPFDAPAPPSGRGGGRYLACNSASQSIPDADPSGVVSEAYLSHDVLVGEVQVYVEITHSWIGDLTVDITSPEGTSVRLHNRSGLGGDEIAGWYDSELQVEGPGSLADFYGQPALGNWTLEVIDHAEGDVGELVLWCVNVLPTEPGGISGTATLQGATDHSGVSVTAQPGDHATATNVAGLYSIGGLAAGPYLLQFSKYGWATTVSETIWVAEGAVTGNVDAFLPAVYQLCDEPSATIPDADTLGIEFAMDFPHDVMIGSIEVYVDIDHTWISDLTVDLTSPEGTTVRLHDRTGSGDDDIVGWYDSELPVDGPGSLLDYRGEIAAGTWTLTVADNASGDSGALNSWCIDITPTAPGAIAGTVALSGEVDNSDVNVSVEPGGLSALTNSYGGYEVTDLMSGTYTVEFSKDGWTTVTREAVVVIGGQTTGNVNATLLPVYLECNAPAVAIPDDSPAGVIDYFSFDRDVTIEDVEVYVDIDHPYIGDLTIDITSPMGTTVRLHNQTGGGGDDILGWYDSELAVDGPGALSDYDQQSSQGTWTLRVTDWASGDAGTLNEWCVHINDDTPSDVEDDSGDTPLDYVLRGAFPNPFNPTTNILLGLPAPVELHLTVYDVAGRQVRVLWDGACGGGYHSVSWDGRDDDGRALGSGVYFLKLSANGVVRTSKALLLR